MNADLNYILTLDVPEKLELIGVIWQSIDAAGQTIEMPDSLVEELDRRKAAAERDPSSLISWESIRQEMGLGNG
jgi:putative addiction module component (TIGR02574 family)